MKKMKKLASLLLVLVMVVSMSAMVWAEPTTGSITINGTDSVPVAGKTFNAYKILDLTVAVLNDATENEPAEYGYAYTVPTELETFYTNHFKIQPDELETNTIHVIVQNRLRAMEDNSDELFAFATAALKAAKDAVKTEGSQIKLSTVTVAENETSAVFSNLDLGYYVVEDAGTGTNTEETDPITISALVLDTSVPDVNINIKADKPVSHKEIVGGTTTNATDVNVGDTVTFKIENTLPDTTVGYTSDKNYIFTVSDEMSSGLTFAKDVVVTVVRGEERTLIETVQQGDTTWKLSNVTDNSFKVEFNSNYIKNLVKDAADSTKNPASETTYIVITYSATLNQNALITAFEKNTSWLTYSNNPNVENSTDDTPKSDVYVYDFDIVIDKYVTDNASKKLAGAKFKLYKMDGESKQYYVVNTTDGTVTWNAEATQATEVITNDMGFASFKGLDVGTYYLTETAAPDGYNKLRDDIEVSITASYNDDGTMGTTSTTLVTLNTTTDSTQQQYQQSVAVANNTGSELPSTGGIGTTLFYVFGVGLMLSALVLLVVKKRVNSAK